MSEYFLNKTPCRLKDIKDLFFDTGMGSHAYSVIERSMVDNILSDNTNHRRFLFEEASGITKYKQRKKEALSKLDATEGDLTRLNDIVFEIERELRSLARQVGKARRFQRLRDEVRDLDLALTAGAIEPLREREAKAKEEWQEEAVRREGVTAELDSIEARLNDQQAGAARARARADHRAGRPARPRGGARRGRAPGRAAARARGRAARARRGGRRARPPACASASSRRRRASRRRRRSWPRRAPAARRRRPRPRRTSGS